jgi:hypothetical protein
VRGRPDRGGLALAGARDVIVIFDFDKTIVVNPDHRTLGKYRREFANDFDVLRCDEG